MAVTVVDRQDRVDVRSSVVARAVRRALAALGRDGDDVEVAIVDDHDIRRLNRAFRGISRRTDVLAFPLSDRRTPLLGQVVISADTARRQARRMNVPLTTELELLVTHGVLHLVGWDDRDPVEAALMHEREREILSAARRPLPDRLWTGLLSVAVGAGSEGSPV
jgi:probable rRNA maturation factor